MKLSITEQRDVLNRLEQNIYKVKEKTDAKSNAWTNFYEVVKENGDETGYVQCKKSKCILKYTGKSTSTMIRHKCSVDPTSRSWKILRKRFRSHRQKILQPPVEDPTSENQGKWPYFESVPCLMENTPTEGNSAEKDTSTDDNSVVKEIIMPEDENSDSIQDSCHEMSLPASPSQSIELSAIPSVPHHIPSPSISDSGENHSMKKQSRNDMMALILELQKQKQKLQFKKFDIMTLILELQKQKLKFKKLEQESGLDRNDEDVVFFLSLLPHMKKLSPMDKLMFRIKVEQELTERVYGRNLEQESSVAVSTSMSS